MFKRVASRCRRYVSNATLQLSDPSPSPKIRNNPDVSKNKLSHVVNGSNSIQTNIQGNANNVDPRIMISNSVTHENNYLSSPK